MALGKGFLTGLVTTTFLLSTVKGFILSDVNTTVQNQQQSGNGIIMTTVSATLEPSTVHGPVSTTTQSICRDTVDNCSQYGRTPCTQKVYEAWAKAHCAMYCGYCTPPVPLPQLCEDKIQKCAEYDSGDLCTDASFYTWAYDNCKGYCKFDMCNESWCEDSKDANCPLLDTALNLCADKAKAKIICRKHCDLCNVIDGQWCSWGTWSACDVSCDNGTEVRKRQCACPAPSKDGLSCLGDGENSQKCTKDPCPVDGGWSSWTDWNGCSVSCGIGMRIRQRFCNNPYPTLSGDHCFGESVDYDVCAKAMCSDGNWTSWSNWTACSKTCGYGIRSRNRNCTVQNLLFQTCNGTPYEYEACQTTPCTAINGGWSSWTSWSTCSHTTCSKERTRTCTHPGPSSFGRACSGNSIDKKNCDLTSCSFFPLKIRLRGGSSSHRGRIEVSLDGTHWGTVCDDSFSNNSAKVACSMLGFPTLHARVDTFFSEGSSVMPIYLDDVSCNGDEKNLLLCNHHGWMDENCSHSEDVGVVCS